MCVASWDNLTNKGLLRIEPDLVVVWNEAQKRERTSTTTSRREDRHDRRPLFDRWFVKQPTRAAEPSVRWSGYRHAPFLLFTGSSSFIRDREPRWRSFAFGSPPSVRAAIRAARHQHPGAAAPYNCHAGIRIARRSARTTFFPRRGFTRSMRQPQRLFRLDLPLGSSGGVNTSAMSRRRSSAVPFLDARG